MKAAPVAKEIIETPVRMMLDVFSGDAAISASSAEGIASGKSILRGILEGSLIVCQVVEDETESEASAEAAPEETE